MLDHHSKYEGLSENALRAYRNCKDERFKKFWLNVYDSIERNRLSTIRLEQIPRRVN